MPVSIRQQKWLAKNPDYMKSYYLVYCQINKEKAYERVKKSRRYYAERKIFLNILLD